MSFEWKVRRPLLETRWLLAGCFVGGVKLGTLWLEIQYGWKNISNLLTGKQVKSEYWKTVGYSKRGKQAQI